MTVNSKMAFDECTFGFVPHSGATYHLSRLPSEFGTFLALTGIPILGTDAAKLKLVDGVMQSTKFVEEDVADVVYSQGYNPREMHELNTMHEDRYAKDPFRAMSARMLAIKARAQNNSELEMHAKKKGVYMSMADRERRPRNFEDVHERIPSSVGDAEAEYASLLRREQMKNQTDPVGYLEYGQHGAIEGDWHYQRVY